MRTSQKIDTKLVNDRKTSTLYKEVTMGTREFQPTSEEQRRGGVPGVQEPPVVKFRLLRTLTHHLVQYVCVAGEIMNNSVWHSTLHVAIDGS